LIDYRDQITLGRQSGEYSPPALCLALTAISSAISLVVVVVVGSGCGRKDRDFD